MLYSLTPDLITFLPELFFLTTTLITLIWTLEIESKLNQFPELLITNVTFLIIEICFLTITLFGNNLFEKKLLFFNTFISDNYSIFVKVITLSCVILYLLLIQNFTKTLFQKRFEFLIILALITFALLLFIASNDLLTFYLSIELQSLCLYILTTFNPTSQLSTEAGLKYFILGALTSSLLLFGISLIYGLTGSTNLNEITQITFGLANTTNISYLLILGIILLICGLLFKLTAVPFHIWSPDVYEGAPLYTTIFLATIPKFVILSFFVKFLYTTLFVFYPIWQPILLITSIITLVISSIATLYQKKIKRFLAYSSINHVGYMLMSLSTGTQLGTQACFMYLYVYLITLFLFFGILISLQTIHGKTPIYLTDLFFVKTNNSLPQIGITLVFFSMAGIPPLIGFFAKLYIFFTLIETHYYLPLSISVVCSTISAFYYIRIIKIINFEQISKPIQWTFKPTLITYNYILIGCFTLTLFILIPNTLTEQIINLSQLI